MSAQKHSKTLQRRLGFEREMHVTFSMLHHEKGLTSRQSLFVTVEAESQTITAAPLPALDGIEKK